MKGLMEASFSGSAIWRGWSGIESPRESMWESAGSHSVGRPQKRWIDTMKEYLRKKRFRCQAREWSRIGVKGRGL